MADELYDSTRRLTAAKDFGIVPALEESQVPSDSVVAETDFGLVASPGTSNDYSRADHTHGTPGDPVGDGLYGIDDLTEGRIPVKAALGFEDSRLLETETGIQMRAEETSPDDYLAATFTLGETGLDITAEQDVSESSPTALEARISGASVGGSGLVGAGPDGARMVGTGLLGTAEVGVSTGVAVAITAEASADGVSEIELSTSGNTEDPTSVTINAAGVAIATGGDVTVNGDEVATVPMLPAGAPTGAGALWFAAAAPAGWLLCDGSAVSRATYAALFAVVSTTYGVGDGSTTFNLPDLRQRFPLGKAASGTGNALAATGGAIDHTHSYSGTTAASTDTDSNMGNGAEDVILASHTHDYSGNTGANNPPFLVVNFIIKT